MKTAIKAGSDVVVIAGAERGKKGRVLLVDRNKSRVTIEGIAMVKRHLRKSQEHPNGTIAEREGTVHISNVMLAERFEAKKNKKAS